VLTDLVISPISLVEFPFAQVAVRVYRVDAAGDTILVPTALTIPIYWSILTVSAPVTFQDRVDVPSELRLLLNSVITAGTLVAPSIEVEPLL
jgi:hypothetical protein